MQTRDATVETSGKLQSIIVDPSFLTRLSKAQHDPTDTEMRHYTELAQGDHPDFRIVTRHSVPLLVRTAGTTEQLVLPSTHGMRQLLMEEFHATPLAGHLGVRKMLDLLY